jgi:ArsR family metal-binding transcriptional regulator
MKKVPFILLAIYCLVFINESYAQKRERIKVDKFSGVSLRTSGNVYIRYGKETSVEIEASEDVRERLDVYTQKDNLIIEFKQNMRNWNMRGNDPLNVYITMSDLSRLNISSSGFIRTENKFKTDNLELKISGSGKMEIAADAGEINAIISGSGNIRMKGSCDVLNPKISGSGKIDAEELEATSTFITISGSGNCTVNVIHSLDAKVSGSGNIYYTGNPNNVNSSISGSGRIKKLN